MVNSQLVSSEFGFKFPESFVQWRFGKAKAWLNPVDGGRLGIELE